MVCPQVDGKDGVTITHHDGQPIPKFSRLVRELLRAVWGYLVIVNTKFNLSCEALLALGICGKLADSSNLYFMLIMVARVSYEDRPIIANMAWRISDRRDLGTRSNPPMINLKCVAIVPPGYVNISDFI